MEIRLSILIILLWFTSSLIQPSHLIFSENESRDLEPNIKKKKKKSNLEIKCEPKRKKRRKN